MSIDSLVNVTITRDAPALSLPAFSTPAIISTECNFSERVRYYSTAAEAAADLWGGVNSYTYKAVSALKASQPSVTQFALINRVGRKALTLNGGTFTAGQLYATVNGKVYSSGTYTSNKATSIGQLVTAINAGETGKVLASYISASDTLFFLPLSAAQVTIEYDFGNYSTGDIDTTLRENSGYNIKVSGGTITGGSLSITINGETVTTAFDTNKDDTIAAFAAGLTSAFSGKMAISNSASTDEIYVIPLFDFPFVATVDNSLIVGTATLDVTFENSDSMLESYIATLTKAMEYDNNWYSIIEACGSIRGNSGKARMLQIADFAEDNKKFAAFKSYDPNIVNVADSSDTTSAAALLKAANYTKSLVIYSSTAEVGFPDAAFIGLISPKQIGSWTAKFKTLIGVTADLLTTTQRANAAAKYAMVYVADVWDMTEEGKVAAGEWIDIIWGIDWLTANIQTNVATLLRNEDKISYDDQGIGAVEQQIRTALEAAINSGFFTQTYRDRSGVVRGGYSIVVPRAIDISSSVKSSRVLTGITFVGYLAGAIHALVITGSVSY